MNNSITNLALWWNQIGLRIKRRKRGSRGKGKNKSTIQKPHICNSYSFPRFLYTNACSLSSAKIDTLQWFSLDYDIICITETWNNNNRDIGLNNFQLYETCRTEKGGGTAVYVRNDMQSTRYNNFIHNNTSEFEITCVVIRPAYLPRSVSVLVVVCVYIPPNTKKCTQFKLFKCLCSLFENARQKYKAPGLIQGDFNKWKYSSSFLSTTNLIQIINFPTFMHAEYKSKLDCIFTNIMEWYEQPKCLIPLKITTKYHICIELLPKETIERNVNCTRKIVYRTYTNDNLSDFSFLVEQFNWKPFYESTCIDFKVRYMNTVINNAFDVAFKEKEKIVSTNNNLWVTKSLLELFRMRKFFVKSQWNGCSYKRKL